MAGERWAGASPLVVLSLVFLLSLPAVTVRLYASDEIEYFAYLRSLWFDHDLSFENEYQHFYDIGIAQGTRPREEGGGYYGSGFHETFLEARTATGKRINFAPIGSALLWAPFYGLADAGVRVARALGAGFPADGFSRPYVGAVAYGSAVYGFLAIVLSAAAVRRLLGAGIGATAAVWLGTPLVFYMYVAPGFSHACSAFAVAAFVVTWLRVRGTWSLGGVVALGALAALMGMVREQDVFIAIGPALDYLVTWAGLVRTKREAISVAVLRGFAGMLTFAVCCLPQLIIYVVLNGRLGPSPIVAQKMTWTSPYAWQLLASPEHGLLFWTPLALPAVAGLVYLSLGRVRRNVVLEGAPPVADAWIGLVCLVMLATQIYVSGSLASWPAAGSFGQRRLVGLTVFFAVGLASLFPVARSVWTRRSLCVLVVVCVWWNLGLIAQFGSGLMNRQRLELSRNAYNNFVTIPARLPSLAYRYVFNRESFYKARTSSAP